MAIRPIYAKERDDGKEGFVWGLGPADMAKIQAGYACSNCLEEFSLGGMPTYLTTCPLCGHSQFEAQDVPEWDEYLKHRKEVLNGPARRA